MNLKTHETVEMKEEHSRLKMSEYERKIDDMKTEVTSNFFI